MAGPDDPEQNGGDPPAAGAPDGTGSGARAHGRARPGQGKRRRKRGAKRQASGAKRQASGAKRQASGAKRQASGAKRQASGARGRGAKPRGAGSGKESRRHLLFAAGGLLAVLATSALLLFVGFARLRGPGSAAVEIDWPAGLDPEQAAELLARSGLVRSASGMAIYLRSTGGTEGFVAGPHLLPRDASPHELRELLLRSPERPSVRVVIPEGLHRFDIADRLHRLRVAGQRAFLAATADRALLVELGIDTSESSQGAPPPHQERTSGPPESAEGFLFPATYDFLADTDAREIVRRLVAESDRRWAALAAQHGAGIANARSQLGWGRRELVTLASIIQREAMVDDERPVIASVFYNRLLDPNFKPRRRLQSDPTAMYGCVAHPEEAPTCADYRGKPTPAVLHDPKNRYSTYMAPGLPPGPISNPGIASLEAALAPASTRFFFFVAKGGGRHSFSETFGAHSDAIRARTAP